MRPKKKRTENLLKVFVICKADVMQRDKSVFAELS